MELRFAEIKFTEAGKRLFNVLINQRPVIEKLDLVNSGSGITHNQYGAPLILHNQQWQRHNARSLKHAPVDLDATRRSAVEDAVLETSEMRGWLIRAINVRTNHVHSVVSAGCHPGRVLNAFKAKTRAR